MTKGDFLLIVLIISMIAVLMCAAAHGIQKEIDISERTYFDNGNKIYLEKGV